MPIQQTSQDFRRALPSVHEVLRHLTELNETKPYAKKYLTFLVRQYLDDARRSKRPVNTAQVVKDIVAQISALAAPHYKPILNLTGIILHTNLGRAPLARQATDYASAIASRYSNLEFDLDTLQRGKRDSHCRQLLRVLFQCEDALVVNNAAAALFLTLHTLAAGKETIASRGELIEIGDSFRLPEIISAAGTKLVEVGTTNRTYASDFDKAVSSQSAALLRAHPSNYQIVGFSAQADMRELVTCARKNNLPLVYDLGSASPSLTSHENVSDLLASGVDLVLFSGDKLLGGPQAGIVVGRKDLIARLQRSPIYRTLRLDKLQLACLDWTLIEHFKGLAEERLPVQRMIKRTEQQLAAMVEEILGVITDPLQQIGARVSTQMSGVAVGGGSLPGDRLVSKTICIQFASPGRLKKLIKFLAAQNPAVVGRLEGGNLSLDPRSLLAMDDAKAAATAIVNACTNLQ